jgi:hypothetical protein
MAYAKARLSIIKVFSATDAQENCFKKVLKFTLKQLQHFGANTIIRERII